MLRDGCSEDWPLTRSLTRPGALNFCPRRDNCKDPKTEASGMSEGLQAVNSWCQVKGGNGERGGSWFMQGHRRALELASRSYGKVLSRKAI